MIRLNRKVQMRILLDWIDVPNLEDRVVIEISIGHFPRLILRYVDHLLRSINDPITSIRFLFDKNSLLVFPILEYHVVDWRFVNRIFVPFDFRIRLLVLRRTRKHRMRDSTNRTKNIYAKLCFFFFQFVLILNQNWT